MERRSIYRAASQQALASALAAVPISGRNPRDPGYLKELDAAIGQWNSQEWWRWVSRRVIEHVQGDIYWQELGQSSFASVTGENPDRKEVLEGVLALESSLDDPGLADFERRRRSIAAWAGLLNQLLDA